MPIKDTGKKPFWRRPMRVMDLALEDSHASWVNHWTAEQVVEMAVRMNANVLNMMVVNEWGQAYWPSRHLPMQPELRGEDRFGAVAERAQQAGLHLSGMWGPTAAPCQSQRHPDWAVRRRDGTRTGWGEKEKEKCFHICMNSPFEDQVNDVADQLFRDLLHLLNHTYDAMFPSPASGVKVPASRDVFRAVTQVIPVHDVKVHLESAPASVKVLIGDVEVAHDDMLVTLGPLGEYAVIEVQ